MVVQKMLENSGKKPLGVNLSTLSVHNITQMVHTKCCLEDISPVTSCCSVGTVSDSVELERTEDEKQYTECRKEGN